MPRTGRALTADEVAQAAQRSVLRTLRILMDVRKTPGLYESVRGSMHFVSLHELQREVDIWLPSGGTDNLVHPLDITEHTT